MRRRSGKPVTEFTGLGAEPVPRLIAWREALDAAALRPIFE
jgi:hypothetical protein